MISLSTRVSLATVIVLTISIALTALALEQAFEKSARSAMRDRLLAQLYLVMAAAEVDATGKLTMPKQLAEPRLNLPGSGIVARIGDGRGTTLWQSPSSIGQQLKPPRPDSTATEHFGLHNLNGTPYFVAALGIEWQAEISSYPLLFSVAETQQPYLDQIRGYRQTLWGWLGGMAMIALLGLLAALAWGLRPLRSVAAEVRAIENGEQEHLQQDYPKEIKHLSDNINTLIHHEHAQQARYKNALGDLAHSLKTPLAVLRGLDTTSTDITPQLQEQIDRMDNIVQYQLQRAATAGRSALSTHVAVYPLLERLVTTLQKVYRDKEVEVLLNVTSEQTFRGDEGDLMEMLGNLLDNAFKWTNKTIQISAEQQGAMFFLCFEDNGPGIETDKFEQVLQRGIRLDEATPGHGIGLPMVRDIVEAYRGELSLSQGSSGGARICVKLPGQ